MKIHSVVGLSAALFCFLEFAQPVLAMPPTVNTMPPIGVHVGSATFVGSVNPNGRDSVAYFQYGLSTAYGSVSGTNLLPAASNTNTVEVGQFVTGLLPGAMCHYRVVAYNSDGTSLGADQSYADPAAAPAVVTGAATNVSSGNVNLNATVNPFGLNSVAWFNYGADTNYGSATAPLPVGNGLSSLPFSQTLTGLTPGQTNHYQVVASNSVGVSYGADMTYVVQEFPSVVTLGAEGEQVYGEGFGMVELVGRMSTQDTNMPTWGFFEYGPDQTYSYGATPPTRLSDIAGNTATSGVFSILIEMLAPGTRYHFRAMASNSVGTVCGQDISFVIPQNSGPQAPIVYVNKYAPASSLNNGSSWQNAYFELRDALNAIHPTAAQPVQIWIAKGTYQPTAGTNRYSTFYIPDNTALIGGFAGNETSANGPFLFANATVLSGDIGQPQANPITDSNPFYTPEGTNILGDPGFLDNCYSVVSCENITNVLLQNLIITGGCANQDSMACCTECGQESLWDMITPDENNPGHSVAALRSGMAGAGLFAQGTVNVSACQFVNNYAVLGGAIANSDGTLNMGNSTFVNNLSLIGGGAVYEENPYSIMRGCTFEGNQSAGEGGAVKYLQFATPKSFASDSGDDSTATKEAKIVNKILKTGAKKLLPKEDAGLAGGFANLVTGAGEDEVVQEETIIDGQITTAVGGVAGGLMQAYSTGLQIAAYFSSGNQEAQEIIGDLQEYSTLSGWTDLLAQGIEKATDKLDPALQEYQDELATIYAEEGFYNNASPSYMVQCRFLNNTASVGGAISATYANIKCDDCLFQGNTGQTMAGAIYTSTYNSAILISSVFLGNNSEAGQSALVSATHSVPVVVNCTFAGNTSTSPTDGYAIGVSTGAHLQVFNSILWSNTAPNFPSGGADILVSTSVNSDQATVNALGQYQWFDLVGIAEIFYSDVQSLPNMVEGVPADEHSTFVIPGCAGSDGGPPPADAPCWQFQYGAAFIGQGFQAGTLSRNHNFSQDPQFVKDYRLGLGSPCINAGEMSALSNHQANIFSELNLDIDGGPRVINNMINMGATEGGSAGPILYVNVHATGNGSGTSWANAMTDFQQALNQATNAGQVWVAAGTYYPDPSSDSDPRDAAFTLQGNVGTVANIFGGFNGTETSLNQRNVALNPTILSGNIGNPNSDSDNCYHVLMITGVGSGVTFDGLTITKGRTQSFQSGGGVDLENAYPIFNNCTFVDNQAGYEGGGLYAYGAAPVLTYCQFINNVAGQGGAMACDGGVFLNAQNCLFTGNRAVGNINNASGGAVFLVGLSGDAEFQDCLFNGNSVSGANAYGGGAMDCLDSDLSLINCAFYTNTLGQNSTLNNVAEGGAVEFDGGSGEDLDIVNSIFWRNRTTVTSNTRGTLPTLEQQQIAFDYGNSYFIEDNIIEGVQAYADVNGEVNVDLDPFFIDPIHGNFQLQSYSPAIGAGTTNADLPSFDLASHLRVLASRIDLGPYESQTSGPGIGAHAVASRQCTANGPVYTLQLTFTGGPPAVTSYLWQVNQLDGNGFINITNSSVYQGATTTNLTILQPPQSWNGFQYRITAAGQNVSYQSTPAEIAVSQPIIYVTAQGAVTGDGSSWSNAFNNLPAALAAAQDCSQIWVQSGVYSASTNGTDTNTALQMKSDVAIYGGFAGTETNLSQRNWKANPTILSGNLGFNRFSTYLIANYSPNSAMPGPDGTLDGFVLTRAGSAAVADFGSSPTFRNCTFATNSGGQGAVFVQGGGYAFPTSPLFINCIFADNQAGGAVQNLQATLTFVNCLFDHNSSSFHGGAIFSAGQMTLINCTLAGNTSAYNGGGLYVNAGSATILNSILYNNTDGEPYGTVEQGQIYVQSGGAIVSNTCVQGLAAFAGNGNTNLNPLFLNPDLGDYHLNAWSPLIGQGIVPFTAGYSVDLDGDPRIVASAVDMGAYEFQGTSPGAFHFLSVPQSANTCAISGAVSFTAGGFENAANVQWQHQHGTNGFANISVGATYGITVTNNVSILTVGNFGPAYNGDQFRFTMSNSTFASAPATITVAAPAVLYVNASANPPPGSPGTNWATAFTNIPPALAAAGPCTEIWVAEGTYEIPSNAPIRLKQGVSLYGGFQGFESDLSQVGNSWSNHVTRIHGLIDNTAYPTQPIDGSAVLNGFYLTGVAGQSAMDNNQGAAPTISQCIIESNSATAVFNFYSSPTFQNCIFRNNTNGAMINSGSCSPGITSCLFANNSSPFQGAIDNENASPVISQCVFVENVNGSSGGAISGNGVNCFPVISDCLFYGNHAWQGGAVFQTVGLLTMINCTIADNVALSLNGGVTINLGSAKLVNCILWDNTQNSSYGGTLETAQFLKTGSAGGSVTISNSCIQGLSQGAGSGNSVYDPVFENPAAGDYRLSRFSPLVDAGNSVAAANLPFDLDGNPRIFGAAVDVGAYELQTNSLAAVQFLSLPFSAATCSGRPTNFVAAGPSATNQTIQWVVTYLQNGTNVTTNVVDDPLITDSGVPNPQYQVSTASNTTTLTVGDPSVYANGRQYSLSIPLIGFVSPPATLAVSAPSIIYVNPNAAPGGDGTSWGTAFKDLADAVASGGRCAEIWVEQGTNQPAGGTLGSWPLQLKSGEQIYGGFAGGESNLGQRDPVHHLTVIAGDFTNSAIYNESPLDGSTIVDGFTIIGRSTVGNPAVFDSTAANPTFQNCIFSGNTNLAVEIDFANPVFQNCVFSGNTSLVLRCVGANPLLSGCLFTNNSGGAVDCRTSAGGIYTNCVWAGNNSTTSPTLAVNDASPVFVNCAFQNNRSSNGGTVESTGYSIGASPQFIDCLFVGNISSSEGGAIAQAGPGVLDVVNCTLTGNSSWQGGGISLASSSASIVNTILWNNQAGGAQTVEQAQINSYQSAVAVSNSCIEGLSAYAGNGNIGFDPLFTAPTFGNYSVGGYSPCLNAGNSAAISSFSTDLVGNPRIFGPAVDIGAYEYQGAALGTAQLSLLPQFQTVCAGRTVQFTVRTAPGLATNWSWQIFVGPGYGPIPNDGNQSVSYTSNTVTLTIHSCGVSFSSSRYHVTLNGTGYNSPDVGVTVNPQEIIYVNAAATNNGNGSSWSNAFNNIPAAVAASDSCSEIWVAAGNYVLPADAYIVPYSQWYGGFNGTETSRGQRNPAANPTRITGTFLFNGQSQTLDNLTMVDGFVFTSPSGSAVAMIAASPTISGCTFVSNTLPAVSLAQSASVIANCLFTNNTGGCIRNVSSSPAITNCVFQGNRNAPSIDSYQSTPLVAQCLFVSNNAAGAVSGGVLNEAQCQATVINSSFIGNQGESAFATYDFGDTHGGAALYNCVFADNSNANVGGIGTAIHFGGNLLQVVNCTVTRNSSANGAGGLYLAAGSAQVVNSIFWSNSVESVANLESAQIYRSAGNLSVSNTCVEGLNTLAGYGNIPYDPLFSPYYSYPGGVALSSNSPAIDAGNTAAAAGIAYDATGFDLRVVGAAVDLGAYEFQGTPGVAVRLSTEPQPQSACVGQSPQFTVTGDPATISNVQWLVFGSNDQFDPITNDGIHYVITGIGSSTLMVSNATLFQNGDYYEYTVGTNFVSAPVQLTVNNQQIIYVNPQLTANGNGSSWSAAFTNLYDALAQTGPCSSTIWVAGGTCLPPNTSAGLSPLQLQSGVRIYGGFPGTPGSEGNFYIRNWTNYPTILACNPGRQDVIFNDGSRVAIDRTAVLDGFTFQPPTGASAIDNLQAGPTITNCTFENSTEPALYNANSTPLIVNCVFRNNVAFEGPAMINNGGSPVISNCVFTANTSTGDGGAVANIGNSGPLYYNCSFTNNESFYAGGAMANLDSASAKVANCVFAGNSCGFSGAGGALANLSGDVLLVENSLFVTNQSGFDAGAIISAAGSLVVNNCTIVSNSAVKTPGGLEVDGGSAQIANSILWLNQDPAAPGSTIEDEQLLQSGGVVSVANSTIEGLVQYAGNGNLGADPLFMNPSQGNFELNTCSPAVDSGNSSLVDSAYPDLAGAPRVFGPAVDMGAYESQLPAATPIQFTALPESVQTCPGFTVAFSASGTSSTIAAMQWQVSTDGGSTFTGITNGGVFAVVSSGGTSQLVITNPNPVVADYQFRVAVPGTSYVSPAVTVAFNGGAVIYVNAAAAPGGDGQSWATAFNTLQSAVTAGNSCSTEIWVAQGTYSVTDSAPAASVDIQSGMAVYGGFTGNETSLSQRDWVNHPTLLMGGTNGSPIINNNIPIATNTPTGQITLLDGFVLSNPSGDAMDVSDGSSLTIRHCTFRDTSGHGVQFSSGTNPPVFDSCNFSNISGCALFNTGPGATVTNCAFFNNVGHAAIQNNTVGPTRILNCVFQGNQNLTQNGGAIDNLNAASVLVADCVFTSNSCTACTCGTDGGALYSDNSPTICYNCLFVANAAHAGGALGIQSCSLELDNCAVVQNSASIQGGGLFNNDGSATIRNSIFWNNQDSNLTGTIETAQITDYYNAVSVVDSIVKGLNVYAGSGNLGYDPLFLNPSFNDFTLQLGSPARNAGNPAFATNGVLDLAGNPRILAGQIDMGPYELNAEGAGVQQSPVPAVFDVCAGANATYSVNASQFAGTNITSTETGLVTVWQINAGGGFANLQASPDYVITTNSGVSTLQVLNTAGKNGYQFRFFLEATNADNPAGYTIYISPASTLNVQTGAVVYVNAAAANGGNGQSWATAFNNLSEIASSCASEVWVARGTYLPSSIGDPSASFSIQPGQVLYGGFVGNETNRNQRDWIANPTILSGNLGAAGNSQNLVLFNGEYSAIGTNTTLDGFVIQQATNGVLAFDASPSIRNCLVESNLATGMILQNGNPLLQNCTIAANTGSGVWVAAKASPLMVDCTFMANRPPSAPIASGALLSTSSSPVLYDCLFSGNALGAVNSIADTNLTFINCTFSGNYAAFGAGIAFNGSTVFVTNCILWNNGSSNSTTESDQIWAINSSPITVVSSCIEGLSVYSGNGNTGADPGFVDEISPSTAPIIGGNYQLQGCSPVLNTGISSAIAGFTTDLAGNPRIYGPAVDPGAYELQSPAIPPLSFTAQPVSLTYCSSNYNGFSVTVTDTNASYQWQVDRMDGNGFTNLADNVNFAGSQTPVLSVTNATVAMNGWNFRCAISSTTSCAAHSASAALTVYPSILFVNAAAAPGGNGVSWATAFSTFQQAVNDSSVAACNDVQVWVAAGTYYPGQFSMRSHLQIYGGFNGTETNLSQRNWTNNVTILDGSGTGYLIYNNTAAAPPYTPIDTSAVLSGFTLQNGDQGMYNYGSPAYPVSPCTPTVTNCVFQNFSYSAIQNYYAGPVVRYCQFLTNAASALYFQNSQSTPVIDHCVFIGNHGGYSGPPGGGGIYLDFNSLDITVSDCIFRGNSTYFGGAINAGSFSRTLTLVNCLISGNVANQGAALRGGGGTIVLYNCTVAGNDTTDNGFATITSVNGGSLLMYNSILWDNIANGQTNRTAQFDTGWHATPYSCCIEGASNSFAGSIASDPLFAQSIVPSSAPSLLGDFHLSPCSPALNFGNNSYVGQYTNDLDGNSRIFGPSVDLGAYESTYTPLQLTTQPVNTFGSRFTPAYFSVVANKTNATFQWLVNQNTGTFVVDATDSGFTSPVLEVSNATPAMNGYQYECLVTSAEGCSLLSSAATFTYTNVTEVAASPAPNGVSTPRNTNISVTLSGNVLASSLNDQTLAVNTMETGRLRSTNGAIAGFTVSNGTATLTPAHPFKPGEVVMVTATSGLENQGGFGLTPFVSEFRAAVSSFSGGLFDPVFQTNLSGSNQAVALGDLNGDGIIDAYFANSSADSVWFGKGNGAFTNSNQSLGSSRAAVMGDFDGNGTLDVATLTQNGSVQIWLNAGGGQLFSGASFGSNFQAMAVGDLNGDGYLDIFLVGNGPAQVWFNDGTGHFYDSGQRLGNTNAASTGVDLADLTLSGALDAFIVNGSGQQATIWLNDGFGNFTAGAAVPTINHSTKVLLGDLNGDGYPDAVIANSDTNYTVWTNSGSAQFVQDIQAHPAVPANDIALGDINGDGNLDIVAAQNNGLTQLWLNDGRANFSAQTVNPVSSSSGAMALADLNGDGALDLVQSQGASGALAALYVPAAATNENSVLQFGSANFGGPFQSTGLGAVAQVEFTSLPTNGVLMLGTSAVVADSSYSAASLADLTYVPATNFYGLDSFTWQGSAGGGFAANVFTTRIQIHFIDYPPVPADYSASVAQGGTTTNLNGGTTSVLANVTEENSNLTLTASLVSGPSHGNLVLNGNGTFSYTQDGSATTNDSFIYQVSDGHGGTANGTVSITVFDVPANILLSNTNIGSGSPSNTLVGTFSVSNPNAGDIYTYALVSGAGSTDNGSFAIMGNSLDTMAVLSYPANSNAFIRVRVTDSYSLFIEKSFTIVVTNTATGPYFISIPVTNAIVGSNFSYNVQAVSPLGLPVSYVAQTLPSWLTFETNLIGTTRLATGFGYTYGTALDGLGYLWRVDANNQIIQKIAPGGAVTTIPAPATSYGTVAVDPANNVIYVGTYAGQIFSYDTTNGVRSVTSPGTVYALAIDSSGNVYWSAQNFVQKYTAAGGTTSTLAGSSTAGYQDGPGNQALFKGVYGISLDSSGNVYVADSGNYRIRKITSAGFVSTPAGNGVSAVVDGVGTNASFGYPSAVASDPAGNLYVVDNSLIRRINTSGVVTTLSSLTFNPGTLGINPAGTALSSSDSSSVYVITNGPPILTGVASNANVGSNFVSLLASDGSKTTNQQFAIIVASTNVVTLTPPSLSIAVVSNQIVISWPVTTTNFYLESSVSLNSPNWVLVTNTPVVTNNLNIVTLPVTPPSKFFRLSVVPPAGPSQPLLTFSLSGNQLVLYWPLSASAFHLQNSTTLGTGAAWSSVSGSPITTNGQYSLTVPMSGTQKLFRLSYP